MFEARCDEDRAQEYALGLWQAGLGSLEPVTELPKAGRNGVEAALRKAFSRYLSVLLDAYCLRGPAALATTQARKPASPRLMDQEPDPFAIEMEIERESARTRVLGLRKGVCIAAVTFPAFSGVRRSVYSLGPSRTRECSFGAK